LTSGTSPNDSENQEVLNETDGLFFVIKDRKKDCIVQGYVTNTAAVPVQKKLVGDNPLSTDTFLSANSGTREWTHTDLFKLHHAQDLRTSIGVEDTRNYSIKYVPTPGRIMESIYHSGKVENRNKGYEIAQQGIVLPNPYKNNRWAFYAPDMWQRKTTSTD
jgi:hypothetical protein